MQKIQREQPKSSTVTEFWQLFASYKQRQAANPGPPAGPAQWVCRTRSGRYCLWTDWWLWVPQEVTPPPWRSVFWTPSGIRENRATPVGERAHSQAILMFGHSEPLWVSHSEKGKDINNCKKWSSEGTQSPGCISIERDRPDTTALGSLLAELHHPSNVLLLYDSLCEALTCSYWQTSTTLLIHTS